MKQRFSLLAGALAVALAFASACGDDHPYVPADGPGSGGGSGTLTAFVIDLIENHSSDPTPAAYSDFSTLPDPDGSANNTAAYATLFQ
ncbi:MAG TPA: hypothetical protein VGL61_00465 [Kofleriaceae bacterium]